MVGTGDLNGGLTITSAKAADTTVTGVTKSSIGDASHYPPDEQVIIQRMKEANTFKPSIDRNKSDDSRLLENITNINHNNMTYNCRNDSLTEKEVMRSVLAKKKQHSDTNNDKIGLTKQYIGGASGDPPPEHNTLLNYELQLRQESQQFIDKELKIQEELRKYQQEKEQQYQSMLEEERESEKEIIDDTSYIPATMQIDQIIKDNNIWYKNQGISKADISCLSSYPPEYIQNESIITPCNKEDKDVEVMINTLSYEIDSKDDQQDYIERKFNQLLGNEILEIEFDEDQQTILNIVRKQGFIQPDKIIDFKEVLKEDDEALMIENKKIKWTITVPVKLKDGTIIKVKMLADAGANAGCVNTEWAYTHFKDYIRKNTKHAVLATPGGRVHPKYVLFLLFPTRSGKILKARLFLVNDLPVNILADLNMLIAFGYRFNDELPPVFRHEADYDDQLDIKMQDEVHQVNIPLPQWYRNYKLKNLDDDHHVHFIDNIYDNNGNNVAISENTVMYNTVLTLPECNGESSKEEMEIDQESEIMDIARAVHQVAVTSEDESDERTPEGVASWQRKPRKKRKKKQTPKKKKKLKLSKLNKVLNVALNTNTYGAEIDKTKITDNLNGDLVELQEGNNLTKKNQERRDKFSPIMHEDDYDASEEESDTDIDMIKQQVHQTTEEDTCTMNKSENKSAQAPMPNTEDVHKSKEELEIEDKIRGKTWLQINREMDFELDVNIMMESNYEPPTIDQDTQWRIPQMPIDTHAADKGIFDKANGRLNVPNNMSFNGNNKHSIGKVNQFRGTLSGSKVKIVNNEFNNVNFLQSKHSFLATDEEKAAARKAIQLKKLAFPNWDYIGDFEKDYIRLKGLHKGTIELCKEFGPKIFAKHEYDRRTLNVDPVLLGMKEEFYNKICYAPQFPIPGKKRQHIIFYSMLADMNGFWREIKASDNCIAMSAVVKIDPLTGKIRRFRPAFDGRPVNKYCEPVKCFMPTLRDFDEFFSQRGLITVGDFKNYFDCIPLHRRDWKWAVVLTPLGLRQMTHLTYGWKNAAAIAQNITNRLCMSVGYMLGYIDDVVIKHPWHYGKDELLGHLRKFFEECEKLNVLLHPGKFYPFATAVDSLGIHRTMFGSRISNKYYEKLITLEKPKTMEQLRAAIGIIGYIGRYIDNYAFYKYWLQDLLNKCVEKQRVKWTAEADYSWQIIMNNIKKQRILYTPTKEGKFCVKTDACNYGIGGALYQMQKDEKDGKYKWRIIDMFSNIIPKPLRKAHSTVLEAYAVVKALENWQFHLLKKPFLISCDNKPVVTLFGDDTILDSVGRKQLARLRLSISQFTFIIKHVAGVDNEVPDGLSREFIKLLERGTVEKDIIGKTDETKDIIMKQVKKTLTTQDKTPKTGKDASKIKEAVFDTVVPFNSEDTDNKKADEVDLQYLKNIRNTQDMIKHSKVMDHLNGTARDGQKWNQRVIQEEDNKIYNRICGEFKRYVKQQDKDRVNQFIKDQSESQVITDEHTHNTTPCVNLINKMPNLMDKLTKMTDKTIKVIQDYTEERNQEAFETCNVVDASLCNEFQINMIEDTDCKEEIEVHQVTQDEDEQRVQDEFDIYVNEEENIQSILWSQIGFEDSKRELLNISLLNNTNELQYNIACPAQTRSQRKKAKAKVKHKIDYIHPKSLYSDKRSHIRDRLIRKLMGYRNKVDFFDKPTFKQYQSSDTTIAIFKYLLAKGIKTPNEIADKEIMQKILKISDDVDERELIIKWTQECLRLTKDEILQAKVYIQKSGKMEWVDVVPLTLRSKIIDYMHHNLNAQHLGKQLTYDNIEYQYWWPRLKAHVKSFVDECELCQYTKHGGGYKAKMRVRELPRPREHIMADFLGPILGDYYILVIVDYFTGYTMLVPTVNCGTEQVFDALIKHWIPLFGLFSVFETDYGSGFDNKIMHRIFEHFNVTQKFAEARNHRGIGKVERQIGFVQTLLNRYNVEANDSLIYHKSKNNNKKLIWERIKVLLPYIQQSINRKRPRFTQYSPNMLMFGSELNDYANIKQLIQRLDKDEKILPKEDYEYVRDLIDDLDVIRKAYEDDWKKYTWISKAAYEKRNKLTQWSKERMDRELKQSKKVLYYIGDKEAPQQKWRQKWSGPWVINSDVIDHSSVQIADPKTGNAKWVSVDRLKLFKNGDKDIMKLSQYYKELHEHNQQITDEASIRVRF